MSVPPSSAATTKPFSVEESGDDTEMSPRSSSKATTSASAANNVPKVSMRNLAAVNELSFSETVVLDEPLVPKGGGRNNASLSGALDDADPKSSGVLINDAALSSLSSRATTRGQASAIISQDSRAKGFRARLRWILAALSLLNFMQVIIFFFLAAPPGMGAGAASGESTNKKTGQNSTVYVEPWSFPDDLDPDEHKGVFLGEGALQLLVSLTGCFLLFTTFVSRHSEVMPGWQWVPRSPSQEDGIIHGMTVGEIAEQFIWIVHCPIGLALWEQRLRYLNGFCVFRLYTVIQAGMELTDFNSPMMRVLANFFGLRLSATVFLRWALEFHKWKVLIPSVAFLWGFLALCFSFAEGVSFGTSLWFIMVTMSTTGYGDVAPRSFSGRLVSIVAMANGLVVLAYVVSQVQELTTRTPHEQKVLDALTVAKLNGRAKCAAACIMLFRFRLRKIMRQKVVVDEQVKETKEKLRFHVRVLNKITKQLQLLPRVQSETDERFTSLADQLEDLSLNQSAQTRMIADLSSVVKEQQAMIKEQAATVKMLSQMMMTMNQQNVGAAAAANSEPTPPPLRRKVSGI